MQKTVQLNRLLEGDVIKSFYGLFNPHETCTYCDGTGLQTSSNLSEFIDEVSNLTTAYVTGATLDLLASTGLASKTAKTSFSRNGKVYRYSAANPLYQGLLKNTRAVKKQIQKRKKDIEREATVEEIKSFINKVNSEYYNVFEVCPYCGGTGEFAIDLDDLARKVVEVVKELYIEKAKGRDEKALKKRITVSNIVNRVKLKGIKVDKRIKTPKQRITAKLRYKKAIIDGVSTIEVIKETGLTKDEVTLYFQRLIKNVRVDTGTLKKYLQDQANLYKEKQYPFNEIIINGPTAHEANPRKASNFIYGVRFISNSPVRNALPWGNYGVTTDTIEYCTIKTKDVFFKYFPRR